MCKAHPIAIPKKTPSNDQPVMLLVHAYYNVPLIPFKYSWYTQYFQQVAKEQNMKYKTQEFMSSTF